MLLLKAYCRLLQHDFTQMPEMAYGRGNTMAATVRRAGNDPLLIRQPML
jgi:hypothetical protein